MREAFPAGLPTPLVAPLLGLDNGNPGRVPPSLLQKQIEWTGRALRDRCERTARVFFSSLLVISIETLQQKGFGFDGFAVTLSSWCSTRANHCSLSSTQLAFTRLSFTILLDRNTTIY